MNLGLEARMHILVSVWSAWMQTHQFLVYQTDELCSQKSLVPACIQLNPGISLKQAQLKCYACQVYGLLKYVYYYEYRTHISVWLLLQESDFIPPCLFIYVTAVVLSEKILTRFLLESFRKVFSVNSIASNAKTFKYISSSNHPPPYASNTTMSSQT